jgi:hypothetical protein
MHDRVKVRRGVIEELVATYSGQPHKVGQAGREGNEGVLERNEDVCIEEES